MRQDAIFEKRNRIVWMLLAFQGGYVNVGGLMSVHAFVSHLSGVPALIGREFWSGNSTTAIYLLMVPVFFFLGAFVTAIPTEVKRYMGKTPIYIHILSFIGLLYFLLSFLGYFQFLGHFGEAFSNFGDFVILMILAISCGSQNALFSNYSKSVLRTTHITGLITDLGIGAAKVVFANQASEGKLNRIRLELVGAFFVGSIVAFKVYEWVQFLGFLVPAALSFAIGARLYVSRTKISKDSSSKRSI